MTCLRAGLLAVPYSASMNRAPTLALPLAAWLFDQPIQLILGSFALATLIIWRHRPNMRRLLAGEEFKIGQRVKEKN